MGTIQNFLLRLSRRTERMAFRLRTDIPPLRPEFASLTLAGHALQAMIDWYAFETVLDVGCGAGIHAELLHAAGKRVTAVDKGASVHFQGGETRWKLIEADFLDLELGHKFDAIWCSHVLEHQPEPQRFLRKLRECVADEGVLAITVPPRKDQIVGGHLTLWNAGLLLYHLVLSGLDCSEAKVLRYGYNVSVLVRNKPIPKLPELDGDAGDVRRLRPYLPLELDFRPYEHDDPFDGDIWSLNWFR